MQTFIVLSIYKPSPMPGLTRNINYFFDEEYIISLTKNIVSFTQRKPQKSDQFTFPSPQPLTHTKLKKKKKNLNLNLNG